MVATRGEVYWLDLGPVVSSAPAKRRPVVVVQSDRFNRSRLGTTIVAALTSQLSAAAYPGNVFVPASVSGLPRDSVVKVTEILTEDESALGEAIGRLPSYLMDEVDRGLRLVLSL